MLAATNAWVARTALGASSLISRRFHAGLGYAAPTALVRCRLSVLHGVLYRRAAEGAEETEQHSNGSPVQ